MKNYADKDEEILGCKFEEILDMLPERLSHGILAWATKTPDAAAICFQSEIWSYQQLANAVLEARILLTERGVRPGDRIMVINENCRDLVVLVLAASELDAWVAIINGRLANRELDLIREDCDPRLIVYTSAISGEVQDHALRHGAEAYRGELVGGLSISACFDTNTETVYSTAADQVLALIYTTGTTGRPKGVMLTHQNLLYVAMVSGRLRGIQPGDRVYAVLPMSHVFGLSAVTSAALFAGACAQIATRFDAKECIRALQEDSVSGFLGVPTMYAMMLETLAAEQAQFNAPALRFLYAGGSPLDSDTKLRVETTFGMPLHNGYGLTESGPTITQTRLYAPLKDCSVGQPLPGLMLRLLDMNGQTVKTGEIGELHVKGPNIMKGYFRNPELTRDVLTSDGWLNTGDLVLIDSAGNVNIAGRTKELIIHSGFNIYPPEVEGILNSHEEVIASAVLGRAVDGNEIVIAYVEKSAGSELTADELRAYSKQNLSAYKVPAEIIFMGELPKAPSGKILKSSLESTHTWSEDP
jgi:acyl-CoA synthetase (AMP-forming)/AMP-acid ligase II